MLYEMFTGRGQVLGEIIYSTREDGLPAWRSKTPETLIGVGFIPRANLLVRSF